MKSWRVATVMMSMLLGISAFAANPFLDAKDDKPVSAKFQGNEWGDEIQQAEIPLTARVVTTRVANMPWGAIFKIEFTDLKSSAPQKREIRPDYFIVTDDRMVLLNEEDNEAAVKKISAMDLPPAVSITRRAYGKQRSSSKAIYAFTMRAIPPVISKRSFGKKALD